jgi:hypothetical protein
MFYLNWTGKALLAQAAASLVSSAIDRHTSSAEPRDPTLGLPKEIYNELSRLAFEGNRAAYMSRLDSLGAPPDAAFRREMWALLGGD